jgi:hypothetical protein
MSPIHAPSLRATQRYCSSSKKGSQVSAAETKTSLVHSERGSSCAVPHRRRGADIAVSRLVCRSITQAIFGLVGVVIGGLLSGGATYVMARRGERRRSTAAVRLVEAEVRHAFTLAESVIPSLIFEDPTIEPIRPQLWSQLSELPTPIAWNTYKGDLAELLTADEWYALADSYEALEALRHLSPELMTTPEGGLTRSGVNQALGSLLLDLERGVSACAAIAGVTREERPRSLLRSFVVARTGQAAAPGQDDQTSNPE